MLNRLQRILNPWRWLGSAALFLIAALAGYSAFAVALETVAMGWFGPDDPIPGGFGHGLVAFFAASTLVLALLNLTLKRSPTQPLMVASSMTITFSLLAMVLLGSMQGVLWSGGSSHNDNLLKGTIVLFVGFNLLLIRWLPTRATHDWLGFPPSNVIKRRVGVVQVVVSGLLLLYLLMPWSTGLLLLKSDAERDRAAVATFGATFTAAKNALKTCPAFYHHVGALVELRVSPIRGSLTDRPNYAIGSYWFNYSGQENRGQVGILVTQSKASGPRLNELPTPADPAPRFTYGPISVFREGDSDSIQIHCDTEPEARNATSGF
ncbi:hypothetical protein [Leptolyngbya sp. PCC 6406]|uniref:hypothetical protein n=1 Tax=Leptolyngbya sp. PCC 6406 TaxID=1173264 RepID=UPI0002AC095F|nr:hypothetical protein [Leptolyngbya sp. PCC 6406]